MDHAAALKVAEPEDKPGATLKGMALAPANATIAVLVGVLGAWGVAMPGIRADRSDGITLLAIAACFAVVAVGLRLRSRLLVTLFSIPLLLFGAMLAVVLFYAPFSWGEGNAPNTRLLQGIVVAMLALLVAGLVSVFSRRDLN
jgi:hypothetical protein